MTTTTIAPPLTVEVVRDLLNQAVAEKGADYVYPEYRLGCHYVENGEPACLIGNALHRAGVPLDVLRKYEGSAAEALVKALGLASGLARFGLQVAQESQDSGETWGKAVENFEKYVADPTIVDFFG